MKYRSHRGGVYYTPENTMHGFLRAIEEGFACVETDPCLTKDGVIILLHDRTINRTLRNADGSEIKEQIPYTELTYEEILQYDAGIAMGEQFKGTKVPTLDELLSAYEGKGVQVALDKKIGLDKINALFDVVARHNVPCSFSCADVERIKTVLARFPDALIDYDGVNTEEALMEVASLVKPQNLTVWIYLDKPNFAWLTDRDKASKEVCERVKRYARLGLANVNNAYDVKEALEFCPDVLEV